MIRKSKKAGCIGKRRLREREMQLFTSSIIYNDILQQRNKYECVGIDIFLSEGLLKRVVETKRAHIHSMLSKQSRQRLRNICDIEKLASVSKRTS